MSKTNCINCGAAKEESEIKCPFCGTVYLDMTTIDFFEHTPVILKFLGPNKQSTIIKAIPSMGQFAIAPRLIDVIDLDGRRYIHDGWTDIDIDISFTGIDVIHEGGGTD